MDVRARSRTEGLSQAQCDAIESWRNSSLFDERQRAVLAYAEVMAKRTTVPGRTLMACWPIPERQVVEFSVLIGAYITNCHVLVALEGKASNPRIS